MAYPFSLKKGVGIQMEDIIKGMINEIFGSGFLSGITDVLTKSPDSYTSAWSFVSNAFNNIILPIGYGFMIIYFLCALIDKSTYEGFNLEQFLRLLIKLFVAKMLLDNGLNILILIMNLGSSLVTSFTTDSSIAANSSVTVSKIINMAKEETNGFGFFESIGFMLKLFIPWISSLIIGIVIKFVCYSRLIEIMVRTVVAPVAMSDIIYGGVQSNGFRYLKSYLAVALQGIIIFVIAYVFSMISADVLTGADDLNFFDFILVYLTMGFSAVALIVRSLGFAKELVGTN